MLNKKQIEQQRLRRRTVVMAVFRSEAAMLLVQLVDKVTR
jgi:hypothetical protein